MGKNCDAFWWGHASELGVGALFIALLEHRRKQARRPRSQSGGWDVRATSGCSTRGHKYMIITL